MVPVTVDGRAEQLDESLPLLEALARRGYDVPHLCHDARLAPAGNCRLCLVEVEGEPHPVIACHRPVVEGMSVRTQSEELRARRHGVLELLAHRHPPATDAVPNAFLRLLADHDLAPAGGAHGPAIDSSHPYIHVDLARCVHCDRCERICRDLQGENVWSVSGRGFEAHVVPDSGTTLAESRCVSCGACVDTCPSGALVDASVIALGLPEKRTRTVCPYCGVGCELEVGVRENRIVQVRPAHDAPVNLGHACVKGRYAFEFVSSPERLRKPLLRTADGLREVSMAEAIAFVAERLSVIRAAHGPDAIGVLGSARGTNEENYLVQKFARTVIGTNNVDCCARVCHGPSAAALGEMLGTGAASSSFVDIELARTILVAGSNTTQNHPVVGARIRQAARRGANLIVVDPRRIELAEEATIHLAPHPGTNIPLFHAMAHVMLDEGLVDQVFLESRVDGIEAYAQAVAHWTPSRAAEVCGVEAARIEEAARLYASNGPAICFHGLGLTEHLQGTEGVMALTNLALLTGNVGRPGTGVNPLRGQNNVQGSAHMGCTPTQLTGAASAAHPPEAFARVWGRELPSRPGLHWMQMVDAAEAGALRALYAVGYDVWLSNPHAEATRRALAALDLLVVQDIFLNETARELAHVVLPAACAYEKDGTFMNSERRVQRVRKVVEPPEGVPTDAELVCAIAEAMGQGEGFRFAGPSAIWDEVRSVWPAGAGMSYARLERPGGLQWPCPDETHEGTQRLHAAAFGKSVRATLRPVPHVPSPERTDAEYPYLLVSGRLLYQFNAGTMTARTANQELQPTDVLRIAPEDAARERLEDDARVFVESRYGRVEMPIRIDAAQRTGELFATFHDPRVFLNRITSDVRDGIVGTPEYKRTAVRIGRV